MAGTEELRETIAALQRENGLLKVDKSHAATLLKALDSVLSSGRDDDPFESVFQVLIPVFRTSHILVMAVEDDSAEPQVKCVAATTGTPIGAACPVDRLFRRALAGRTITTLAAGTPPAWSELPGLDGCVRDTALYLPIGVKGRRAVMVLLRRYGDSGFDRDDVELAHKFSTLASHAFATRRAHQSETERLRLEQLTAELETSRQKLHYRANHDQLTGLPNRAYTQELVSAAIARKGPGEKLALAFVDLDNFKRVNDIYGHIAGDDLLKEVARRIRATIRSSDMFGRISGDEFVIALDPALDEEEAGTFVERIQMAIASPFQIGHAEIRPSASIGVAIYPTQGVNYEMLRRYADMAMYQAKQNSGGRIVFFNRELRRKARRKRVLERALREALEAHSFHCALQKKVDMHSGEIMAFEALLRWKDRTGAIHTPGAFLPLATELGMLDEITDIVVDNLIGALPELDAVFGTTVRYSINVSPAQAANLPFMHDLIDRIRQTGRAHNFMIELTEESLTATGIFCSYVLPLLRGARIGLSIDDFGTGYSSLATIADLEADELKIDRSLVMAINERPRNQSILRAIESMAGTLGLSVVAEGIEKEEERRYFTDQTGIGIAQGFLFHKPQLIADLLRDHARPSSAAVIPPREAAIPAPFVTSVGTVQKVSVSGAASTSPVVY